MILRKTALVEVENNQLELSAAQSTDGSLCSGHWEIIWLSEAIGLLESCPGSGVLLSPDLSLLGWFAGRFWCLGGPGERRGGSSSSTSLAAEFHQPEAAFHHPAAPKASRETKNLLNSRKGEDKHRKLSIAVFPCWVWCQTLSKGAVSETSWSCPCFSYLVYRSLYPKLFYSGHNIFIFAHPDFFWSSLSPFLLLWPNKLNCWDFQRSAWGASFQELKMFCSNENYLVFFHWSFNLACYTREEESDWWSHVWLH